MLKLYSEKQSIHNIISAYLVTSVCSDLEVGVMNIQIFTIFYIEKSFFVSLATAYFKVNIRI